MKINLTKENARYIVNEEKGKVICIFQNTGRMFIDYADKNLRIKPDCDNIGGIWNTCHKSSLYPKLKMPNKFIGVATCDANDTFSIETGKLIAYNKAKNKIQRSFFKRANLYINTIDKWLNEAMDNINRYGEKLETNTARRHDKIVGLVGEPEKNGKQGYTSL